MYKRYICLTVPGKESRQRVAQWDQDGWAFFLKGKPSHVGWEDRHIDPTLLWCRKHMAHFLHFNISSNLTNPQHLCLDLQVRKLWVPSCGFYDSLLSPKTSKARVSSGVMVTMQDAFKAFPAQGCRIFQEYSHTSEEHPHLAGCQAARWKCSETSPWQSVPGYMHHYWGSACPELSDSLFLLSFWYSFYSLKKKKRNFCLSCSLLKQIGSYYVAVSQRLFCSGLVVGGNQWKETWGTKPPELYWVIFDSLKRSQSSLLSGVSRGLCQVMSEIQMLCKSPTSFHLCSHAKCFLRKGRLSAFMHALPL